METSPNNKKSPGFKMPSLMIRSKCPKDITGPVFPQHFSSAFPLHRGKWWGKWAECLFIVRKQRLRDGMTCPQSHSYTKWASGGSTQVWEATGGLLFFSSPTCFSPT